MSSPKIDLDKLAKPQWSAVDRKNAEAVVDFVQLIMNDHDFDEVTNRYSAGPYKQHNRNIADGIGGVIATVGDLVKNAPDFSYDVKHIYVDGDHVILHSHATLKARHRGDDTQGMNIIDIWKVADGQLTEQWDAVQGVGLSMRLYGLVAGGKVRNTNGVF